MNIDILLKNIDVFDILLNIDILVLNIHILISQKKYENLSYNDILPDILNNDIFSSYWKRGSIKLYTFLVSKPGQ